MNTIAQAVSCVDGYDPDALRVDRAVAAIRACLVPISETQKVPTRESLGRILAQEIVPAIDVPGHEKFVRTMVAGATSMDLALLVVAADDGPMLQTREHVDILDLLGVRRVIVVMTKTDIVDADHADLVEEEIRAMLRGTCMEGAPVLRVSSATGAGIEARIGGHRYRIGSPAFALELTGGTPAAQSGGDTVVSLASESGLLASFRLADALRSEAAGVVDALKKMGVAVHLLSGDAEGATQDAAARVGIGEVRARATPERKLQYVAQLQRQGRKVAMVGDGINDAPVLARAGVSLAMGGGTRLAQAQADVLLLSGTLVALPEALVCARLALRIVRQNIAWAFAYNLLALPLAVSGWLTPWAAAIGMSGSSLLVVLNALRLGRLRRESGKPAAFPAVALSAT